MFAPLLGCQVSTVVRNLESSLWPTRLSNRVQRGWQVRSDPAFAFIESHTVSSTMAHLAEQFRRDWRAPKNAAETRVWDHVGRVFGRRPDSIRPVSDAGQQDDAYLVKIQWNLNDSFEFICANGLLVCIPPRRGH